jgi:uncharacterized protein YbaR (Trm112 family)
MTRAHVAPDPALLAILVCPVTRAKLRLDTGAGELVSDEAGIAYPVRSGVPVMLAEEARRFEPRSRNAD